MSVSESHIKLVNCMKEKIERDHNLSDLIIYSDNPESAFKDKVPKIGFSYPDIYARSYAPDLTIIGEAKTLNDVENKHSLGQYKHYLEYCSKIENSLLLFAAPWVVAATLKNTIRNLKIRLGIPHVSVVFLEMLEE